MNEATEAMESTEFTKPTEPVEATEPIEPVEATEPIESVEATESTEVTDTATAEASESMEDLRAEITRLRAALDEREREKESALRELKEFSRLFPDTAVKDVPAAVWDQVEKGLPLSAAYALYEREQSLALAHAEQINRRNASLSAGKAGMYTAGEYFTPDEVRAMTQKQVHDNYEKIKESMKTWI